MGAPPRTSPWERRWALCLPLVAACAYRAAGECGSRFLAPPSGAQATHHNGVALNTTCFPGEGEKGWHHVFVIGDWGGPMPENGAPLKPADNTHLNGPRRDFIWGVDDSAQLRVARQMIARAPESKPDYVLNVGDAFYWGGITVRCGAPPWKHQGTGQWSTIFETVYKGPGLDGKQWLGVLGNHDYGGYHFTNGWDQQIGYTWTSKSGRWMLPAQYWSARVEYVDFSVDYFFLDTNTFNAWEPHEDQDHNICGLKLQHENANCGPQGPHDVWTCAKWFADLWEEEMKWLDKRLSLSDTTWQIVVTHFPADINLEYWQQTAYVHGVDLIISGHRHSQEVHAPEDMTNLLRPTAYLVSGGGGGITAEGPPSKDGKDDWYGFMDLSLSKYAIRVEAISHGGDVRRVTRVKARARLQMAEGAPLDPDSHPWQLTPPKIDDAAESAEPKGWSKAIRGSSRFRLTRQDCREANMREIMERDTCIAAALDLQLPVAKLNTIADESRIEGCFFLQGYDRSMLWLAAFPPAHEVDWKHLCQKRHAGGETWT